MADQQQQAPNAPPAGADQLAQALQALTQVLTNLQNQNPAPPANPNANAAPAPLLDPFATNDPFDLSSRAGSLAFATACSALDDEWDGTTETFPPFLISLKIRAAEVGWNAAGDSGILRFETGPANAPQILHLLDSYYSLDENVIETARTNRTNNRAIQNSRAMYKCLKNSITGDLKSTVFSQQNNLPPHEDGPSLFKRLTPFTTASSLQLAMTSFNNIISYDPSTQKFHIPAINTDIGHLFMLASTAQRPIGDL